MNRRRIPKLVSGIVENMFNFKSLPTEAAKRIIADPKTAIANIIAANDPILVPRPKEDFILDAVEGGEVSFSESGIFSSFNCINCKISDLEITSPPSLKTIAKHHELVKDANFFQMLAFFAPTVVFNKLFFTVCQFLALCAKLKDLKISRSFLIPIRGNDFFVANVRVYPDGLSVRVRHFEYVCLWYGSDRHRVVVPQLVS